MRWTEQQLADHLERTGIRADPMIVDTSCPPFSIAPGAVNRMYALGRLKTGEMNKTEAAYDQHLWARFFAKEIAWHKFEALKFRLADNTFYTPDFILLTADGYIEVHEVKGFMMEDSNVKIKVAAAMYPFKFFLVKAKAKRDGGGFSVVQHGA